MPIKFSMAFFTEILKNYPKFDIRAQEIPDSWRNQSEIIKF